MSDSGSFDLHSEGVAGRMIQRPDSIRDASDYVASECVLIVGCGQFSCVSTFEGRNNTWIVSCGVTNAP